MNVSSELYAVIQGQRQDCRQKMLIYQKIQIRHTKAVEFAKRYDKILVKKTIADLLRRGREPSMAI
jgi:hypothetical protein